ncbi:hypothetical protein [Shewanella fodinae]|uniref:DUF1281 family ferredoxin-like fold protein n=1 Tax=Shewanella fodinae TaxID=552357 RepID=UPI001673D9ED|nr:hypothetical protein [Shewanella fodinae]MCL2905198.1 hypothetical protein [Shewanella fodinae]GGY87851.1 hypothetical protein GCM10007169_01270 [Shewanella fodinae]
MPNHVTNIIEANNNVIASMLNEDKLVDFCIIIPCHEDLTLDNTMGISAAAESAAEMMCNEPVSENDIISQLQLLNRSRINAIKMNDHEFEQFVKMMRNKRNHGFYHEMEYARKAWGTKWNAYNQISEENSETMVRFDTAWSHPYPVIEALSKKFPDEVISVKYADEDTGSNCGTYSIKNGEIVEQNIAPSWSEQTDEQKRFFREFAFRLRHPNVDPREYGYNENFEYDEEVENAYYEENKSA